MMTTTTQTQRIEPWRPFPILAGSSPAIKMLEGARIREMKEHQRHREQRRHRSYRPSQDMRVILEVVPQTAALGSKTGGNAGHTSR